MIPFQVEDYAHEIIQVSQISAKNTINTIQGMAVAIVSTDQ